MANFPALKMTAAGKVVQAKAQTGQLLKFTRVALGDGEFVGSPDALLTLVSEKQSLSIRDQITPGDGTSILNVIATNKGVASGFYMREIATFAEDPDTGEEILYSYSNAGAECDFLPGEGGSMTWEGLFDLITVVGNAENVTAVIDDYITIALKSEVEALRPYILPTGGVVGDLLVKDSNDEGAASWKTLSVEGLDIRLKTVEEPRVAVSNQSTFTLRKTVTNGLAVYVGSIGLDGVVSKVLSRLPGTAWAPLSATQLKLNDALAEGTPVLFVNNEKAGPGVALNVSLDGPTLVYAGSSNTYTLSDYDAFSQYTLAASLGSVTRSGKTLTLVIPSGAPAGTMTLGVTRDNVTVTRAIAVGSAGIMKPEATTPAPNASGVGFEPDLAVAPFQVVPVGFDTLVKTRWQVALDAAFTQMVYDAESTANLTDINLGAVGARLLPAKKYYWRAKFTGQTLASEYSAVVAFNTAATYIRKPAITNPVDGTEKVSTGVTLRADAFSASGGDDVHQASRWQTSLTSDFSSDVVDSGWSTTQLTSYNPAGLGQAKTYYSRVKYRGAAFGESEWSAVIRFVTAEQLKGTYTALPGGATIRAHHAADTLNGDLFVFGGRTSGASELPDFWKFSLSQGAWTQLTSFSVNPQRRSHQMVALAGLLYVIGGSRTYNSSAQYLNDMFAYNPSTDKWVSKAANHVVGENFAACADGSAIFTHGGYNGQIQSALMKYDPVKNTWSTLDAGTATNAPKGCLSGSLVYIDGALYAFGGRYQGGGIRDTLWKYDLASNTWVQKSSGPAGREGHAAVVINGRMYVYGGSSGTSSNESFTELWVYDPGTDVWQKLTSPAPGLARTEHTLTAIDGKAYLFGGLLTTNSNYSYQNTLTRIE